MNAREFLRRLQKAWHKPAHDGDLSLAKMFKILGIFCVCSAVLVTPIMYWRHSDSMFMRFLWADASVVMADLKCNTVGWCPR